MKRTRGFTLIELLVVIAIITLLISILLPSLSTARELSKRVVCAAHLKGIGTAGRGQLYIDGELAGQVDMPVTNPIMLGLASGVAI